MRMVLSVPPLSRPRAEVFHRARIFAHQLEGLRLERGNLRIQGAACTPASLVNPSFTLCALG